MLYGGKISSSYVIMGLLDEKNNNHLYSEIGLRGLKTLVEDIVELVKEDDDFMSTLLEEAVEDLKVIQK